MRVVLSDKITLWQVWGSFLGPQGPQARPVSPCKPPHLHNPASSLNIVWKLWTSQLFENSDYLNPYLCTTIEKVDRPRVDVECGGHVIQVKKRPPWLFVFSFVLCGGHVIQVERHSCSLSFSWADANIFNNLFISSLHLKTMKSKCHLFVRARWYWTRRRTQTSLQP